MPVSVQNISAEESRLLDRCEKLFMRYGIKSVTMDDVSRELGISKKTLYQYVENKDALICKVTKSHFACENKVVEQIIHQAKTAIDEMFGIATWMNQMSKNLNPGLLFDLRKYHPDAWQIYIDHRNNEIYNHIKHNLQRGIKEELYRENLHVEVLTRIYIARAEMFLDHEIFPYDKFPPEKTFPIFLDYHIRGIATQKGIKYLEKIKSQHNDNQG
ncbi:MAG: TetR/AcrR family transcriptional regulator [Chitinophagales bacterium]